MKQGLNIVTNIYIDQLSAADALELFNYISERDYLSNAECNYQSGHNSSVRISSVRIECYGNKVYGDLAQYFLDKRNA